MRISFFKKKFYIILWIDLVIKEFMYFKTRGGNLGRIYIFLILFMYFLREFDVFPTMNYHWKIFNLEFFRFLKFLFNPILIWSWKRLKLFLNNRFWVKVWSNWTIKFWRGSFDFGHHSLWKAGFVKTRRLTFYKKFEFNRQCKTR